jgi:replicative DNA helicase
MSTSWFKDAEFQEHLLSFVCKDRVFLKKCGYLLNKNDFKPGRDETDERYIVAQLALDFWKKHKSPIGGMLRTEIAAYIEDHGVNDKKRRLLRKVVDKLYDASHNVPVSALEDRVITYLKRKLLKDATEEILDLQAEGELSVDKFLEVARELRQYSGKQKRRVSDFLEESEFVSRQQRRAEEATRKRPLLFIDDLDSRTRMLGRGDLGLVVGLYKKGKSLLLAHIADAYAKQGLKVLYLTLEDPKEEVEDRMDASLAYMPIEKLGQLPRRLKKRFKKFSKRISGRIRIVDCTDGKLTVGEIDEIFEQQRDEGFVADVIIVDYDKELIPSRRHKERRFEFEEIYTELRQLASRKNCILWTAAQTKRLKESVKVITGDMIGEDIGKAQKVTMMIGLGQGESHPDARYLFIALHKRGRAQIGCEIMANPSRGLIYDREATILMKRSKKLMRQAA